MSRAAPTSARSASAAFSLAARFMSSRRRPFARAPAASASFARAPASAAAAAASSRSARTQSSSFSSCAARTCIGNTHTCLPGCSPGVYSSMRAIMHACKHCMPSLHMLMQGSASCRACVTPAQVPLMASTADMQGIWSMHYEKNRVLRKRAHLGFLARGVEARHLSGLLRAQVGRLRLALGLGGRAQLLLSCRLRTRAALCAARRLEAALRCCQLRAQPLGLRTH